MQKLSYCPNCCTFIVCNEDERCVKLQSSSHTVSVRSLASLLTGKPKERETLTVMYGNQQVVCYLTISPVTASLPLLPRRSEIPPVAMRCSTEIQQHDRFARRLNLPRDVQILCPAADPGQHNTVWAEAQIHHSM